MDILNYIKTIVRREKCKCSENVLLPLTFTSDTLVQKYYASYAFKITEMEMSFPGTVLISLNGSPYSYGTLINKYDELTFTSNYAGFVNVIGDKEYIHFADLRVSIPIAKEEWSVGYVPSEYTIIGVTNVGNATFTNTIAIRFSKNASFTFTPNIVDTSVVIDGESYLVNNDQFTFVNQATRYTFTALPGTTLEVGESLWIAIPTVLIAGSPGTATFSASFHTTTTPYDFNTGNNSFNKEITIV